MTIDEVSIGLSSAHIFYIPIIFIVGLLAGFFMGRRAAEKEAADLSKRRRRRQALRDRVEDADGPSSRQPASSDAVDESVDVSA